MCCVIDQVRDGLLLRHPTRHDQLGQYSCRESYLSPCCNGFSTAKMRCKPFLRFIITSFEGRFCLEGRLAPSNSPGRFGSFKYPHGLSHGGIRMSRRSRPAAWLILLGKIWAHGQRPLYAPTTRPWPVGQHSLASGTTFDSECEWVWWSGATAPLPGTEERWVHIIGFADAPTPAVAQPRKASSDNASGVGCFAAVGADP